MISMPSSLPSPSEVRSGLRRASTASGAWCSTSCMRPSRPPSLPAFWPRPRSFSLGWAADFWLAFRQRVLANVFAIITIPPLIVITATGGLGAGHYRRWSRYAELGLLTMALLAVGFLVFGRVAPASGNVPALLLTPMPLLLWAAVRLGPGGLCFCLLVIAGLSLSEAFAGRGPFVTASPAENTFSLQVFLLAISAPLMILAAIVQERRRAEDEARREREELAHVLRIATLGELTASLAHEINQPLTAIMTNAQAARRMLGSGPGGACAGAGSSRRHRRGRQRVRRRSSGGYAHSSARSTRSASLWTPTR